MFIISIVLGIPWLFICLFVTYKLYFLFLNLLRSYKNEALKRNIIFFFKLFYLLFIGVIIRLLVFDVFFIPSQSMENTLFPKDIIIVDKLKHGPILPSSLENIPWLNLMLHSKKKQNSKPFKERPEAFKRLSGYSRINNGDVFVFKHQNIFLVKRCIGVPGDTLEIKRGTLFVNNIFNEYEYAKNKFRFKILDRKKLYAKIKDLEIKDNVIRSLNHSGYMSTRLTTNETASLKKSGVVDSLQMDLNTEAEGTSWFFFKMVNKKWTINDFGPLIIPKKNMKVELNDFNYQLYKYVILNYERKNLTKKDNSFLIDGQIVDTYTFENNYYFVLGDNRADSRDSRFIGFIPENEIIGKAQFVLLSNYQNEFQWKRFFKKIN